MNVLKLVRYRTGAGRGDFYRPEIFPPHVIALEHLIERNGFFAGELRKVEMLAKLHGLRLEIRDGGRER